MKYNGNIIVLILLFLSLILVQAIIYNCQAADINAEIMRMIKKNRRQYVKQDKKVLNISWIEPNTTVQPSSGPGTSILKTVRKGNVKFHLKYSRIDGSLTGLIVEAGTSPRRLYLYNVNYPTATLKQISIIYNENNMMSFEPSGKTDKIIYKNTGCKSENAKGKIINSPLHSKLCRKQILMDATLKGY